MNSYEIGTMVGNIVGWVGVVILAGLGVWLVGAVLYFTYLDILDAPRRRAVKAGNAQVAAIKAATAARNRAECARIYGTAQVAADNDRKWWELTGRRD